MQFFLPKTVYLKYYYNLCILHAYYHIFINISNKYIKVHVYEGQFWAKSFLEAL